MAADGSGAQALAANVDVVLITCGLDRPVRAGRIHRAAAQAWDAGARPVLLLTKSGASGSVEVDLPRLELEHPGMQVLVTSAREGVGLDGVRDVVAGCTAVLVGESGAGKSTLTNALLGRDEVATGAVREGDAKGRHTTTSRQLHLIPGPGGGALIDTPGIRSLGLLTDTESVDATFGDLQAFAGFVPVRRLRARQRAGVRRARGVRVGRPATGALRLVATAAEGGGERSAALVTPRAAQVRQEVLARGQGGVRDQAGTGDGRLR